jgi:hypothetical protein
MYSETYVLLIIIQIISIYNAISMGWKVKKIDTNKYELSKQIPDINLSDFIEKITRLC